MDSPDRDHTIPPSSPQIGNESPAFQNFLSNLSPIKSFKKVHVGVGHVFSELSFPPPPPVFTSPRIGIRKEPRSQYPDSSNVVASGCSGHAVSGVAFVVAEVPSTGMLPCVEKETDCEEVHSQASSPSRFVDEYLADDSAEEECTNAVDDSPDLCSSQAATEVPRLLEGDCTTSSKETTSKIDEGVKDIKVTEKTVTTVGFSEKLASAECVVPAKEELLGENSSMVHCIKPGETEEGFGIAGRTEKKSDGRPVDEEQLEDLVSKNAADLADLSPSPGEAEHQDEWDSTSQLVSQSAENVQANDNADGENSGEASNEATEIQEASLNQRGMRRRCLQFEAAEARRKSIGSHSSSLNPVNMVLEARPAVTPMLSETFNSFCIAEQNTDFSSKHMVNFSKQTSSKLAICPYKTPEPNTDKSDRPFHDSSNSPVTAPVMSGIGLHLNSLGNSVAMSCSTNMQLSERDYLNAQGERSLSGVTKNFSEGSRSCSVSVGVVVNVSVQSTSNLASPLDMSFVESTEIDQQENEVPGMGYPSDNFHAVPLNVKSINSSLQSNLTERCLRPCEKKRSVSQDAHGLGEFIRSSPKKKRRKPPDAIVNEGCKRCNCKKSKCLKLYCECFAAGVYCVEPCTCQECFNKPEHEDTVLATRQQIESRNPLAFAPRIIRRVTESPSNSGEDVNQTPASARHKRGCNCKKSKCLKKYCECYQAGVGCSDGCRCEGCKNIFGKKDGSREFIEMEYTEADDDVWEDPSEEKLDIVEISGDNLHPEHCHSDLSPITPIFQCSSLGREMPKSQHHARGDTRAPDSEISNVLLSYGKPSRSPGNSNSSSWFAKGSEGNLGLVPLDKGHNYPKAEKMGRFSPKWDGLEDIYSLTPLSDSSLRPAAAAASGTRNFTKHPRGQLCHGSGRLSAGSVHWRSSPVTPMPHIGAKVMLEPDSDSGVHNIMDDDTPEILKDTNSPIKVVKVSSPNQKRVSPPHNCLQELRRSVSSPGLKSGRKFILQSVPSFPPLSPYSEAKGNPKQT